MARRLDGTHLILVFRLSHLLGGGSGIDQPLDDSVFHQLHTLSARPLAIERCPGLQRMGDIVSEVNVLAENPGTDAVIQKGPLIENSHSSEVIEHETNDVEY